MPASPGSSAAGRPPVPRSAALSCKATSRPGRPHLGGHRAPGWHTRTALRLRGGLLVCDETGIYRADRRRPASRAPALGQVPARGGRGRPRIRNPAAPQPRRRPETVAAAHPGRARVRTTAAPPTSTTRGCCALLWRCCTRRRAAPGPSRIIPGWPGHTCRPGAARHRRPAVRARRAAEPDPWRAHRTGAPAPVACPTDHRWPAPPTATPPAPRRAPRRAALPRRGGRAAGPGPDARNEPSTAASPRCAHAWAAAAPTGPASAGPSPTTGMRNQGGRAPPEAPPL